MPRFKQYVGIDYSGAETPAARLRGLRVFLARDDGSPLEVAPRSPLHKYWSRREVAEWLVARLTDDEPSIVGIDHGFSFPLRYFEAHHLPFDWPAFLDDFQRHWPTDRENTYVDFVRVGADGNGAARTGNSRWRRLTEKRAGRAKSVFHFDVPGSVAKSTHSGIPWLRFIRQRLGSRVHFWPFDGWEIPEHRSVIAEVYPALWCGRLARDDRSSDQHDAFSIAAWLSHTAQGGSLSEYFAPALTLAERSAGRIEGWILGVPGSSPDAAKMQKAGRDISGDMRREDRSMRKTTQPGHVNKNNQTVVKKTNARGNDHNQLVYVLRCLKCKHEYGANGSDIWQRRCPRCDGGAQGLAY